MRRIGPAEGAGRSTVEVSNAVGIGILAELTAGVLMIATGVVGVLVTS